MWEAETRRTVVPGQPRLFVRPYLNRKKLGTVVHTCHPATAGSLK
jgi:hypothetical protein